MQHLEFIQEQWQILLLNYTSWYKYCKCWFNSFFFLGISAQTYIVFGTYQFLDVNNCVLEILNLLLTKDIAEESRNTFTIFLNPTNGNGVISLFSDDQCRLNVYDSQGQLVFENPSISNGEGVNLSNYSPGVHIFEFIRLIISIHVELLRIRTSYNTWISLTYLLLKIIYLTIWN